MNHPRTAFEKFPVRYPPFQRERPVGIPVMEPMEPFIKDLLGQTTSLLLPIGSMYGIYANIEGILMVNVTIYSIHGSYGIWLP